MIATFTRDRNYEVLLCEYAAGTLDESCALIVASHVTLCQESREMLHAYEHVGGTLLDKCEEALLSDNALSIALEKIELGPEKTEFKSEEAAAVMLDFSLPKSLEKYIIENVELPLKWKKVLPGMLTYDLPMQTFGNKARLIKMEPGASVPAHGHGGQELTLIIEGAMSDEYGTYEVGDLIIQDERFEHTPTAHKDYGCVCLAVTCAPIKLKGWASILNPFLKK